MVRYPTGMAEDIPVKIQGFFIPVDFVLLDMETTKESPLILGRPFLSTVGAHIDVGAREICFNINGKEEKFDFQPRQGQCSMIRIKYGPNPQGIKEVERQPQLVDSLAKKNKENKKRPEQKKE